MRSIQSRLVNQTILMVNRTISIQQILFDSIQSIQSRVNQTPVWMLHWHQFGVKSSFRSTRSATGKVSFTLISDYTGAATRHFSLSARNYFPHINIPLCLT